MSGYTLKWKGERTGPAPIDGSIFRPDLLCPLSPTDIAVQTLRIGRTLVPLGELFRVEPREDGTLFLEVEGVPPLDRLGAGMRSGNLTIVGSAGDDLGASMGGGFIQVRGDAGHRVGGPDATSDRGMSGGAILVQGNTGDLAGLRMRRGLIGIAGKAGRSPGYRMLAGTIVLGEGPVDHPGLEMRRGTIVCMDASSSPPPSFAEEGIFEVGAAPVLSLLSHELVALGLGKIVRHVALDSRFRLYSGDRFELNRGEVWQWVS